MLQHMGPWERVWLGKIDALKKEKEHSFRPTSDIQCPGQEVGSLDQPELHHKPVFKKMKEKKEEEEKACSPANDYSFK